MGKYVDEPMMSQAHDSTLRDVLTHAGKEDGNKFASASVKTAAAKVLLTRLAEQAS